jgi:hypothetical protein
MPAGNKVWLTWRRCNWQKEGPVFN